MMMRKDYKTLFTFLKAQVSSIAATVVDFLITIFLAEFFHVLKSTANLCGVVCGGVVNFLINRKWVFEAAKDSASGQLFRYVLVWLGNIFLNQRGFILLTKQFHIEYILAKVIVAVLVGVFYNYFLQKKFVFKNK